MPQSAPDLAPPAHLGGTMLTSIYIDNFKSLVDFRLPARPDDPPLGDLVTLIGLNGAGKTTLLQALDFLSHVMQGKVEEWLS